MIVQVMRDILHPSWAKFCLFRIRRRGKMRLFSQKMHKDVHRRKVGRFTRRGCFSKTHTHTHIHAHTHRHTNTEAESKIRKGDELNFNLSNVPVLYLDLSSQPSHSATKKPEFGSILIFDCSLILWHSVMTALFSGEICRFPKDT